MCVCVCVCARANPAMVPYQSCSNHNKSKKGKGGTTTVALLLACLIDKHTYIPYFEISDSDTCALSIPESRGSLRTDSSRDETAETRRGWHYGLGRCQGPELSSSPPILVLIPIPIPIPVLILILVAIQDARAISHAVPSPPLSALLELYKSPHGSRVVPGLDHLDKARRSAHICMDGWAGKVHTYV